MYGVVVCSRCKRPKAADLRNRTTSCQCGSKIDLGTAVIRYQDPSALKVAEAVRAMTSKGGGMIGDKPRLRDEGRAVEAAVEAASSASGKWPKASRVAEVLTERGGKFTEEEFVSALEMLGRNDAREILKELMAKNVLVRAGQDAYAFL